MSPCPMSSISDSFIPVSELQLLDVIAVTEGGKSKLVKFMAETGKKLAFKVIGGKICYQEKANVEAELKTVSGTGTLIEKIIWGNNGKYGRQVKGNKIQPLNFFRTDGFSLHIFGVNLGHPKLELIEEETEQDICEDFISLRRQEVKEIKDVLLSDFIKDIVHLITETEEEEWSQIQIGGKTFYRLHETGWTIIDNHGLEVSMESNWIKF